MLLEPDFPLPPADGWFEGRCRGRWALDRFPRLASLASADGTPEPARRGQREAGESEKTVPEGAAGGKRFLEADVVIREAAPGQWVLEGSVESELDATCQRCLEPMALQVQSRVRVALTETPAAAGEPGDTDGGSLAAYEPMDWPAGGATLGRVLEDEVLLAMPALCRHEDVRDCGGLIERLQEVAMPQPGAAQRGEMERPFDGLKDMLAAARRGRDENNS